MILFRVDGNSSIGMGHIMRCLSIAEAAIKRGVNSKFIIADAEPASIIKEYGFDSIILGTSYDNVLIEIDAFIDIINRSKPDVILFDSYFITRNYLSEIEARIGLGKIAVIDDLRTETLPCDLLIHYAFDGQLREAEYKDNYNSNNLKNPKLLLGEKFAPLRSEFKHIEKKHIRKNIRDVLILSGGSDVCNISYKLIKQINESTDAMRFTFHIVIGSLCDNKEELFEMASYEKNVTIYENYKDMAHLMQRVDFAITAAGMTLMELCACGTPAGVYFCADNQLLSEEFCKKIGMPCLGDARDNENIPELILSVLFEMNGDFDRRLEVSNTQQKIIDGEGSNRIVDEIIKTTGLNI